MSYDSRKRDRDQDSGYDRSSKRRSDEEPISTLFVSGLPADLKDRELKLLGTFLPGFEGAVLNRPSKRDRERDRESKDSGLIGFMKFVNQEAALGAAQSLQNYVIDDELPEVTLRISLAKRNMNTGGNHQPSYLRNPPPPAYFSYSNFGSMPFGDSSYFGGGDGRDIRDQREMYDQRAASSSGSYHSYSHFGGARDSVMSIAGGANGGAGGAAPQHRAARVSGIVKGSACDTLCVRGLTPWTTDMEIEEMFSKYSGYTDKMLFRSKQMAFVRFAGEREALAVLEDIDQTSVFLPGANEQTTVLVEYAKRSLRPTNPNQ